MNKRELVEYLKENGFWEIEGKRRHDIFTNGVVTVPVHKGSKGHKPWAMKAIRAKIRNSNQGRANVNQDQKTGTDASARIRSISSSQA